MKSEMLLSESNFRWVSKIYFHVTRSTDYNVNPFKNILDFLNARVGELQWGKDDKIRTMLKDKFSQNLALVLELYNYHISKVDILNYLNDEQLSNADMIQRLIASDLPKK
jgi:hypothetical protein